VQFSLLYKFLRNQVFTPSVKNKCRVYLAKDLRSYQKQYHNIMHQLLSQQLPTIVQHIDYDNFLLKRLIKSMFWISLLVILIYA